MFFLMEAAQAANESGALEFGHIFSSAKGYLGILVAAIMAISWIRLHHKRKKVTKEQDDHEVEQYFEKDENGLYPWEADTDDDPKHISKDAKPISHNWGPQRGRW